jgi:hypothetical protein
MPRVGVARGRARARARRESPTTAILRGLRGTVPRAAEQVEHAAEASSTEARLDGSGAGSIVPLVRDAESGPVRSGPEWRPGGDVHEGLEISAGDRRAVAGGFDGDLVG